ncbi:hypothetical protein [Bradyrhizobium erythrophlei]|uniref:Uncharacterized protein n=1 Tax=Bradyrhizobium erythrophlei TaxID=1437360 RepID=A0A1H4XVB7_9BRAD|nr:hypothetical protein [Bradyrhizobium erythrophlei]SED09692.1 hypothetical protein SAMN05444164_3678 [Bradyrhizobium erythrophlei]
MIDREQFLEDWRLLGERVYILKTLSLAHPRGLAEAFLLKRERSGSKGQEATTIEEIRQIGEAVTVAADLVQCADKLVRDIADWCDTAQAQQKQEALSSLQGVTPAGNA